MKIKCVKEVLTATLMATMLVASSLTVAAETGGDGGTSGDSGNPPVVEQPEEPSEPEQPSTPSESEQPSAPSEDENQSDSSSGSSESKKSSSEDRQESSENRTASSDNGGGSSDNGGGSSQSSESQPSFPPTVKTYSASAPIMVAGTQVKTTVAGAFDIKEAQGAAVVTPLSEVKASLGLTGTQAPYVMAFDTDAKKSNLAMGCVNATAEALGGEVVTSLNVTLGAKENGKIVSLANGSAGMAVGLPKKADQSKTYSVVCVQPGGVISILEDQDNSPATVTFEIKAGIGTYGIIAK